MESPKTLVERASRLEAAPTAVVHRCDAASSAGAADAASAGLIHPWLVGPAGKIDRAAESAGVDISAFARIDTPHSHASAERAVAAVREGQAEALMKGSLHTDELMQEILRKDAGLRTERRPRHVCVLALASVHRLYFVTDAATNIYPDLSVKADIVRNAIDCVAALGLRQPKIALLSAVETVTPKIPSTIDAAALCKMADRGQIVGGVLDGPLAFDNAVSPEAAAMKGIVSDVAGHADILVAPDMEAGNMIAKQMTYLAGAKAAGVVMGARVPVILTSRADDRRARLASAAVAALVAAARRTAPLPSAES